MKNINKKEAKNMKEMCFCLYFKQGRCICWCKKCEKGNHYGYKSQTVVTLKRKDKRPLETEGGFMRTLLFNEIK